MTPQNTEAMPTAAQSPGSNPVRDAKKLPNVAPIKSDGTISPPLYSPDSVMTVKMILSRKAYHGTLKPGSTTQASMILLPAPL